MQNVALSYAARGWSVIPLRPKDKRPLLPAWSEYQNRRPVEQEVRAWWRDNPDANLAIVTGAVSGLVVLDLDGPEAVAYAKERGVPRTPVVATGKGYHIYFAHPGGKVPNAAGLGGVKGLDLRGDGGYVVAPPSVHPSGRRYTWAKGRTPDDLPLAPLPEWVLELLKPAESVMPAPRDPSWVLELLQGVPQGRRNDATTRLAGHWLGKGLPEEEVWLLLSEWNRKNSPPLPKQELWAVLGKVARREARKPEQNKLGRQDAGYLPGRVATPNEWNRRAVVLTQGWDAARKAYAAGNAVVVLLKDGSLPAEAAKLLAEAAEVRVIGLSEEDAQRLAWTIYPLRAMREAAVAVDGSALNPEPQPELVLDDKKDTRVPSVYPPEPPPAVQPRPSDTDSTWDEFYREATGATGPLPWQRPPSVEGPAPGTCLDPPGQVGNTTQNSPQSAAKVEEAAWAVPVDGREAERVRDVFRLGPAAFKRKWGQGVLEPAGRMYKSRA